MELKEIFLKLDKVAHDIADLRVDSARSVAILDRNSRDIEHHIRRTDALETSVQILKEEVSKTESKWRGALWAVTAIFGALVTALQLWFRLIPWPNH